MAVQPVTTRPEIEEGPSSSPELTRPSTSTASSTSSVVIICPNNSNNNNNLEKNGLFLLDGDGDNVTADVCSSCREVLRDDRGVVDREEFRITTQCSCSINAAPDVTAPPVAPLSLSGPSLFVTVASSDASVVSISSVSDDDDDDDDDNVLRYYTRTEIGRHDTEASAWIVAGDNVYDVTDYVESHPGGRYSIMKKIGGKVDCTRDLLFHSKRGQNIWKEYQIGKITDDPSKNGRPIQKEWWKFWEWA